MKAALPVFALVSILATGVAHGAAAPGGQAPAMPVEGVTLEAQVLERKIEAVGSLRADEAVVIRPEVAGRVAQVLFEEGQAVKAGEPIVVLDTEIQSAELHRAEANLKLADVEY